jgi:hypothetical protein
MSKYNNSPTESVGTTILDLHQVPDYDVSQLINTMKNQGIMPLDSNLSNTTTIEDLSKMMVNVEVVNQFALAGDLIATGDLTPKEWFKLKMLIRSENPENNKLAEEILKAKSS